MAVIAGVGPDAPVVVDARTGAKQSRSLYRSDLLPAEAVLAVAAVLSQGATKYGENNWRPISTRDHINHCLNHLFAWLASDDQDDHLSHAATRALMALWRDLADKQELAVKAAIDRYFRDYPGYGDPVEIDATWTVTGVTEDSFTLD